MLTVVSVEPTEITMSTPELHDFKAALPPSIRKNVNQETLDRVQELLNDPDTAEQYRENLMSYTHVMRDGKFKIDDYISAVKYVTHKLLGRTNQDAYRLTFPQRYQSFIARKFSSKEISSYVAAYNKTKLVNLIMEQTIIPAWILNQDLYQKALNTQAELMVSARSEKVRSDAANSILTHLKRPEAAKIELDMNVKEDSALTALRESTLALVAQQKQMLQAGAFTAKELAASSLVIEGELDED